MEEKTKGIAKKNIYLILLAVAIAAVAIIITVAIASNSKSNELDLATASSSSSPKSQVQSSSSIVETSSGNGSVDEPQTVLPDTEEPNDQTDVAIVFVNPVSDGYVLTEYTSASVVYNQTLGIYTGHMGLDIAGKEGADVVAAFDGEIDSITTTYLRGTTVVIRHADGLMTVYNSLDIVDGLEVGQKVSAGEKIGTISTNNRQEYKDGAHLHFEVEENGKTVDPYKYLTVGSK